MVTGQARARRGRLVTFASVALVAVAVGVLVVALLGGHASSGGSATGAQSGGTHEATLFVGQRGCSDSGSVRDARDASTPWCTLRHAISAAPAGNEVRVAPGRYGSLHASGGSGGLATGVTFAAQDPRNPPVVDTLTLSGVSRATFSGFRFTQTVNLLKTSGVTIRNDDFAGGNLYLRQTANTSVIGNHFEHVYAGKRAILAQGSYVSGQPTTTNLLIRGNTFNDIRHDAIAIYNGYKTATVEGNKIYGVVRMPGFPFHSDSMQFMGGDGLTVRNNVMAHDQDGILVKDGAPSTHLVIAGNLITDTPRGAGLQIFNGPGAIVSHNTIWNTAYGTIFNNDLKVPGRTSVHLYANVLDQLIVNAVTQARVLDAHDNVFGRGRFYGQPAYRGRPNFQNPKSGDLRIRAGAPGAGISRKGRLPGAQLSAGR